MTSIMRDGKIGIGAAMAIEFAALFLVLGLGRVLAGQAAVVAALGAVGIDLVVAAVWLVLTAVALWGVAGLPVMRRGAVAEEVAVPSRGRLMRGLMVAGYVGDGVIVALFRGKFILANPIEWGDMAFLNLAARAVAEVVAWPWTVMAVFGA